MSGPDTLSQVFGTLLLALVFSAFTVLVRGCRPGGVSGAWYDLVLAFVATWLAFWPEVGVLARSLSLANTPGLVLQAGVTLLGCLLGYGVARGLRRAMRETRQKRSVSLLVNRRGSWRGYQEDAYNLMALRIFQMLIRSAERALHP